ncbi:MAG: hypothetical protein ABRQ39_26190 [Candidatus Eremiobacterota bacterium]
MRKMEIERFEWVRGLSGAFKRVVEFKKTTFTISGETGRMFLGEFLV